MKEKIVSLCKVIRQNDKNTIELLRLADIKDGKIEPYFPKDNEQKFFEDREHLFWKQDSRLFGDYGIWEWISEEHVLDPYRDYVKSSYLSALQPFQIVLLTNVNSVEELINCLKVGVFCNLMSNRILLAYENKKGVYTGLILNKAKDEFYLKDDKIYVSNHIMFLQIQNFNDYDIFSHLNNKFYIEMEIKKTEDKVLIKSPFEVVQNLALTYFNKERLKSKGLGRKEQQRYREILHEISEKNFLIQIQEYLKCSLEEAKDYVEGFIDNINDYINEDDIDSLIIQSIIENHYILREKFEQVALEKWKREHLKEVSGLRKELDDAQKDLNLINEENCRLQDQIKSRNQQLTDLESYISKKELFIQEIEDKISFRLKKAKSEITDFIAENAFYLTSVSSGNINMSSEKSFKCFFEGKEIDPQAELEPYEKLSELVDTLSWELVESGVSEVFKKELASFIYFSYYNKQPLLFSGPCGESIANALSVSLFAKTAGIMDCLKGIDEIELKRMLDSDDRIIILKNVFNSDWFKLIPDIIMNSDKYFILTTHFAEDLIIEPRGIFNFMFPVLTEFFVDKVPGNDFIGGIEIKQMYSPKEKHKFKYSKDFQSLGISNFLLKRLSEVFSDINNINSDKKFFLNCVYLLGLFPYAYVTDKVDILLDKMKNKEDLKDVYRQIVQYLGMGDKNEGEID